MAGKVSSSKARAKPRSATRFIVYRTAQGYWIASAKDGCVTGAFPVPPETVRLALRRLQSRYAPRTLRRASASQARSA